MGFLPFKGCCFVFSAIWFRSALIKRQHLHTAFKRYLISLSLTQVFTERALAGDETDAVKMNRADRGFNSSRSAAS